MHIQSSESEVWNDGRDEENIIYSEDEIASFFDDIDMSYENKASAVSMFRSDVETNGENSPLIEIFYNFKVDTAGYNIDFSEDINTYADALLIYFILSFAGYFINLTEYGNVKGYFNVSKFLEYMGDLSGETITGETIDQFTSLLLSSTNDPSYMLNRYCVFKNYCTNDNVDSYLEQNGETVATEFLELFGLNINITEFYDSYFPFGTDISTAYIGTSVWHRDKNNEYYTIPVSPNKLLRMFNSTELYNQIYPNTPYTSEQPYVIYPQTIDSVGFYIGSVSGGTNTSNYLPEYVLISTLDLYKHSICFPEINLTLDRSKVTRFTENNKYVNFIFGCTGKSLVEAYTFNNSSDRDALLNYFTTEAPAHGQSGTNGVDIPIRIK